VHIAAHIVAEIAHVLPYAHDVEFSKGERGVDITIRKWLALVPLLICPVDGGQLPALGPVSHLAQRPSTSHMYSGRPLRTYGTTDLNVSIQPPVCLGVTNHTAWGIDARPRS
jgi:hypothetical protein